MKFRVKMTLAMLGLLSLLFGVGGSLLISTSFRTAVELEREGAYHAYQMVVSTLRIVNQVSGQSDYGDIAHTLEQLSAQTGQPWSALRLETAQQEIYAYGPKELEFPRELDGREPGVCTIRYFAGESHYLALSGTLAAGEETMTLDMGRDISPLFEARRLQQQAYRRVFLLMTGLCALLAYTISALLTRPLESLSRTTRTLALGKLSSRVRVVGRDEVGTLARDFNRMAEALEETVAHLQDTVERQERFMGSFAHEVKTPMTSIIGYADLLRGGTLTSEEGAEAANYIFVEGRRLERLSQKLLQLLVLKQGAAQLALHRPAQLIQALAQGLEPIYRGQGIALTWDCSPGACRLEGDLFRSILLNLLDNARKAMAGRGGHIHLGCDLTGDGCVLRVTDDGPGIPPEALTHLTEAFYRADSSRSRAQGGAGLGLALCGEIARLHGGCLRFESEPGVGTTVTVELRGGVT